MDSKHRMIVQLAAGISLTVLACVLAVCITMTVRHNTNHGQHLIRQTQVYGYSK